MVNKIKQKKNKNNYECIASVLDGEKEDWRTDKEEEDLIKIFYLKLKCLLFWKKTSLSNFYFFCIFFSFFIHKKNPCFWLNKISKKVSF